MCLILRTHGGLGNQIFQVLFARLYAESNNLEIFEIHDDHYKHSFPRSEQLIKKKPPSNIILRIISSLRLPKILNRIFKLPEKPLRIMNFVVLDGYFQEAEYYRQFPLSSLNRHLNQIRQELNIGRGNKLDSLLVHLRLGDFFLNSQDAIDHVIERLMAVPIGSSIITNDESLLSNPSIVELMNSKQLNLISTQGFDAEDVLRVMSSYKEISANDSTMTFWASVLGEAFVHIKSKDLRETCELFKSANI